MKVLILWLLQATHDVAATNNDVEGLKVPKCHTPSQTHANVFLRTSPSSTIVTTALIIDAGVCQRSLACTTARAISSYDQGASSPTSCFSITHHGFTSFNTLDSCFLPSTLQPESSVTCVYFHFILCPLPLPSSTKERPMPASAIYKLLSTPAFNHRQFFHETFELGPKPFTQPLTFSCIEYPQPLHPQPLHTSCKQSKTLQFSLSRRHHQGALQRQLQALPRNRDP